MSAPFGVSSGRLPDPTGHVAFLLTAKCE